MLCNILKTGTFKDSNGKEHTFTTSDLDRIVDNFNNKHNRVPICVGHPKTNSPAYGWFNSVKRIGENLYCDFKQVQDEFKTAVQKGLFKNRSISLDGDMNIRHLAFLGGQAPAIKGLEEFCFESRENSLEIEINDFMDYEENDGKDTKLQEEMNEKIAALEAEKEKLKNQLEELQKAEQTKNFEDFCSEAVKNGNILPKHKDCVMNILQACSDFGTFNFSDKEENAVDSAKSFIKSIKMFDFEDYVKKTNETADFSDFDESDWEKEIKKVSKEHNITEVDAIRLIKRGK